MVRPPLQGGALTKRACLVLQTGGCHNAQDGQPHGQRVTGSDVDDAQNLAC